MLAIAKCLHGSLFLRTQCTSGLLTRE